MNKISLYVYFILSIKKQHIYIMLPLENIANDRLIISLVFHPWVKGTRKRVEEFSPTNLMLNSYIASCSFIDEIIQLLQR